MGQEDFLVMLEHDGRGWNSAATRRAWNAQEAAELFVRDNHSNLNFRQRIDVRVKSPNCPDVEKVTVHAEPTAFTFKAYVNT